MKKLEYFNSEKFEVLVEKFKKKEYTSKLFAGTGYDEEKEAITNAVILLCRRISFVISSLRKYTLTETQIKREEAFNTDTGETNASKGTFDAQDVTNGVYLNLKKAYQRCSKKYFYCPCSKVNEGNVAFRCNDGRDDGDKSDVRVYAQECSVQLYRSLKTLPNESLMWS